MRNWSDKTPIDKLVETTLENNQPYDLNLIKNVYKTHGYGELVSISLAKAKDFAPADMTPQAIEFAAIRIANELKRAAFPNGTDEVAENESENDGKMTVKKLKEMYKGQFCDCEMYEPCGIGNHYPYKFHTDNCRWVDDSDYADNTEVGLWELMDEETYQHSILANSSEAAEFAEMYEDRNAKVLVMMLAESEVIKRAEATV